MSSSSLVSFRGIFLITGISAAGKSTVAGLLANRLARSVHLRGDLFRRVVVNGRMDMSPDPTPEAVAQLRLRYEVTAFLAERYFDEGFSVVVQDLILGPWLTRYLTLLQRRPLYVVVLTPRVDVALARDAARAKSGYTLWAARELDQILRRATPRVGLWLDNSDLTPNETVEQILGRARREGAVA